MANINLGAAKSAKNDEFYTQESDIVAEINYYKSQLRDKIIYCNCDDYHWSNFYKLLKSIFLTLGLKKLTASCYNKDGIGEWAEFNGTVETTGKCESNGSFSDPDNIERLKEADIVITNPPFSLFRDFIATMEQYDKKFLVIGNKNALTYKEVFKLIKNNNLRLGYTTPGGFTQPEGDEKKSLAGLTRWFTNLDVNVQYKINRAKENLNILDPFYKYHYDPEVYPKYDNYDAINVDKVAQIPNDYFGEIGVPITFMDYYDPNIWEIVGMTASWFNKELFPHNCPSINNKETYKRIIIKRK